MAWEDGLYVAQADGAMIQLRIDRNGAQASQGRTPPTISLDYYDTKQNTLVGTFRTPGPASIQDAGGAVTVALQRTADQAAMTLVLSATPEGSPVVQLSWNDPLLGGEGSVSLAVNQPPRLGVMRSVQFEFDYQEGVPAFVANQSIALPPRDISVEACLREAGIEIVAASGAPLITGSSPWTVAEICNAIYNVADSPTPVATNTIYSALADWRAYVLLAQGLVNEPGTVGIMPDARRRGCAILYGAIDTHLTTPRAKQMLYIFTVMHEVGHMFNLPHSFERYASPFGEAELTFMNYPQLYTSSSAISDLTNGFLNEQKPFFTNFPFRYDVDELMDLRHGDFLTIAMGGSEYRGALGELTLPQSPAGRPGTAAVRLDLRVRRGNKPQPDENRVHLFEFGEPVHCEARLTTANDRGELVECYLDPSGDRSRVLIRRPDGRVVEFESSVRRCRLPELKSVTPREPLFQDISLTSSREGFTFLEPGRYSLRMLAAHQGAPVLSNELLLHVRYPDRDAETLVAPILTQDVARYLAIGGGRHLTSAIDKLERLRGALPSHPLVEYYRAYSALTDAHEYKEIIRRDGKVTINKTQPKPDPTLFRNVVTGGAPRKATRARSPRAAKTRPGGSFSNLFLERVGRLLYQSLVGGGDPADAASLLSDLKHTLVAQRNIPAHRLQAAHPNVYT